jgi:hypothetical protein
MGNPARRWLMPNLALNLPNRLNSLKNNRTDPTNNQILFLKGFDREIQSLR